MKGAEEEWSVRRQPGNHWYNAQADYVLKALEDEKGKCLVIGSPLFEAVELQEKGWEVTYADVRKPPMEFAHFIQGDAAELDFGEETFNAVSSTCVLCHAGMGRYGDPDNQYGDIKIIGNIYRSLKSGGLAVLMFGPVYKFDQVMRLERAHKIYTIRDACAMTGQFRISQLNIFDSKNGVWTNRINDNGNVDKDYLSMVLEKP